MDYSPQGSSVHGIFQARILEWVTIPFSRASSWPRDWTQVSCFAGRFFNIWATRKSLYCPRWKSILASTSPESRQTRIWDSSLSLLLFNNLLILCCINPVMVACPGGSLYVFPLCQHWNNIFISLSLSHTHTHTHTHTKLILQSTND